MPLDALMGVCVFMKEEPRSVMSVEYVMAIINFIFLSGQKYTCMTRGLLEGERERERELSRKGAHLSGLYETYRIIS